jgi:hypothetical protein
MKGMLTVPHPSAIIIKLKKRLCSEANDARDPLGKLRYEKSSMHILNNITGLCRLIGRLGV